MNSGSPSSEEFIALRVEQPFGEFFVVKFKADFLLERSFSRVAEYDNGNVTGNQREVRKTRLDEIEMFIDSNEAAFPNPIIISANYDYQDNYVDDERRWSIEPYDLVGYENQLFKLRIPTNEKVSSIIDGQHRLLAFNHAKNRNMELLCSVYIDLPPAYQAAIFATINFNQTKVNKSLAYQLFGYQLDEDDRDRWSPDTFAVYLSRVFNETETPFNNRIKFRVTNQKIKNDWSVSTAALVEGVISLISRFPKVDRYKINKRQIIGHNDRSVLEGDESLPLRSLFISGNDKAISQVILSFFSTVEELFWTESKVEEQTVLVKTIGVSALFEVLKKWLIVEGVSLESINKLSEQLRKLKNADFSDKEIFRKR